MLERASSSAECTAHQILRRFELPTRSRRALDPGFWKQGGDHLDVPVWWPAYLSNVRSKAQAHCVFPDTLGVNPRLDIDSVSAWGSRCTGRHGIAVGGVRTRPFTRSAIQSQQLATSNAAVNEPLEARHFAPGQLAGNDVVQETSTSTFEPLNQRSPASPHTSSIARQPTGSDSKAEPNATIYQSGPKPATEADRPDYARAWTLFAESEYKAGSATGLMQFLGTSDDRVDLRHAIAALEFIPKSQRSQEDYEVAVQIATKLNAYRTVTVLAQEAASKQMSDDLIFKFMAHCVENTLWNTLATFWAAVQGPGGDMQSIFHRANYRDRSLPMSTSSAGRYASHFDNVIDLPGKIVVLADRILRSDAVIANQKGLLTQICKRLALLAVQSQKTMSVITVGGAVALFQTQQRLEYDSALQLAAIKTINGMTGKGAWSQLALLTYRNYRFVSPDATVPPEIYRSMLAICSDGRQRPETYEYLLEEFARMHERPDDLAFQVAMSACASQGESAALHRIFDEFCRVSSPKSLYHLNPLIHVYATLGNVEDAQSQFDRLQTEFSMTPDVVSWTSLILAHARSAESESAFDILDDMKKAGIQPNAYTWSILTSIASKRGDLDRTQALYNEAKGSKLSSSSHIEGALIDCLLSNDQPKRAEHLVLQATGRIRDQSPIRLWNSLFRYYAFKADDQSIGRLQELMASSDVEADGMTYAALMTSLVVQKRTDDAAKLLRDTYYSRSFNPTEFHYSILIHGFVKEGKRDAAVAMYHEMQDRFPGLSPSSRLAMLHLQLDRDEKSVKALPKSRLLKSGSPRVVAQQTAWHGLDYLASTLVQQSSTDVSSKNPNPGLHKVLPHQGIESIYMQTLINFLQSKGVDDMADQLMAVSAKLVQKSGSSFAVAFKDLNLQLQSAIHGRKWSLTDEIWHKILNLSTKRALPLKEKLPVTEEVVEPSAALPALQGIELPNNEKDTFKSMISRSEPEVSVDNSTNERAVQVLPVHRFMLSYPLSAYMQSLDSSHRHYDIIKTVQEVVQRGFALTSMNWNRYIQTLSKSPDWEQRLTAFVTFEEKFLSNTPPWRVLRRSKWLSPTAKSTDAIQDRKKLEKVDPGTPRPSYYTMIHLATALMRVYRSTLSDHRKQLDALQRKAAGTLSKVQRTPHLRDRIQGVLLRGRKVRGDPIRRPRAPPAVVHRYGIRGSKSPADDVPPDLQSEVDKLPAPLADIRSLLRKQNQPGTVEVDDDEYLTVRRRLQEFREKILGADKSNEEVEGIQDKNLREKKIRRSAAFLAPLEPMIRLGEQIAGEIVRSPIFLPAAGRMETTTKQIRRVQAEALKRLELVERIRTDTSSKPLIRDPHRGDPLAGPAMPDHIAPPGPSSTPARELAETILYGDKEGLFQGMPQGKPPKESLKFQPYAPVPKSKEAHVPDSWPFNELKKGDPPKGIYMPSAWNFRETFPAIDTSVLVRKIAPRYIRRDKNTPVKWTNHKDRVAWSRNKAKRRRRLNEVQAFARWNKKTQALQEERSHKIEAEYEAERAKEKERTDDSNRVARLAMSRGARRA